MNIKTKNIRACIGNRNCACQACKTESHNAADELVDLITEVERLGAALTAINHHCVEYGKYHNNCQTGIPLDVVVGNMLAEIKRMKPVVSMSLHMPFYSHTYCGRKSMEGTYCTFCDFNEVRTNYINLERQAKNLIESLDKENK